MVTQTQAAMQAETHTRYPIRRRSPVEPPEIERQKWSKYNAKHTLPN